MKDNIKAEYSYSTTRNVTTEQPIFNEKYNDKFKTMLFLPKNTSRKGEGGLRTLGRFKSYKEDKPLITVITAVYNGEKHLEETINSIINQSYDNVEYIIVDGGSTDGTLDIIKKHEHAIDYWVSEKDKGISDAFNKAVTLSTGNFINFQGDGDGFNHPSSLDDVFLKYKETNATFVSARIQRTSEDGLPLYNSREVNKFKKHSLLFRMSLPHQGLFTNILYFKEYGLFDVNNKYCMDYEHLLRSYKNFPGVYISNVIVANWRADGLGNGKTLEILNEYNKIKKDNNVTSKAILYSINIYIKFKYYIKKGLGFD